ncbi:AraC-like DNA-binding protein [Spinactinospora alkalitolerans]|uniref:AraC-like DNA-binding protein n=1 Tax=Spinactinospora alkalitolerans TaxID=687207 RepID=A0A852TTU3_9ACTN|nr:helix-turn-helix domain-containing protein [Spinactinospora alkalitolerans]NYE45360.1 AraC-like DNA-binding protein [Spinactinospora alkalitolerans]
MSWYAPSTVAAGLSRDLVTGWTARIEGEHRLLPDGCVDVLWIDDGTVRVCGPETAAWSFRLPPGTEAVGVRFRPGRAGSVLGFDTADVRDRRVSLDDVLGSRAQRHLIEQIGEAADPATRIGVLQGHVRGWLAAAPPKDPVAETVSRMLAHDIGAPVTAMAEATGLGERQLHRRCTAAFGYGPATLRRILRLQRFLRLARYPGAPLDLARLAFAAGYTDQSHLSRDCRAIARATGQDEALPAHEVHRVHTEALALGDNLRMDGICGPAVGVAEDAPEQERLLAFLGRTP